MKNKPEPMWGVINAIVSVLLFPILVIVAILKKTK